MDSAALAGQAGRAAEAEAEAELAPPCAGSTERRADRHSSRCSPCFCCTRANSLVLPELPLRCAPARPQETKSKTGGWGQERQFSARRARYAHGFKRPRVSFLSLSLSLSFLPGPRRHGRHRAPPLHRYGRSGIGSRPRSSQSRLAARVDYPAVISAAPLLREAS
jgi:hypothetical protein